MALPRAGPDIEQAQRPGVGPFIAGARNDALLDYLLAHTKPGSYLVATLDAHGASLLILATGRPVLTLGGFNGGDNVVDAGELAGMVAVGELEFVLGGPDLAQCRPAIGAWLRRNYSVIDVPGLAGARSTGTGPGRGPPAVLFDCGR